MAVTYVKDTPVVLGFGLIFTICCGWWLRRVASRFNFNRRFGQLLFLFDYYELVGGFLIGVLLLAIAALG